MYVDFIFVFPSLKPRRLLSFFFHDPAPMSYTSGFTRTKYLLPVQKTKKHVIYKARARTRTQLLKK